MAKQFNQNQGDNQSQNQNNQNQQQQQKDKKQQQDNPGQVHQPDVKEPNRKQQDESEDSDLEK